MKRSTAIAGLAAAGLAGSLPYWLPRQVVALRGAIFTMVNGEEGMPVLQRPAGPADFLRVYGDPAANGRSHGAGLSDQIEAAFRAVQQLKILFAGKVALRLVGIEGQAVKVLFAFGGGGLCRPFGEGAGQVLRDGITDFGNFNPLVVERVHQVCRHLLATAALIALEDHILIQRRSPFKPGLRHALLWMSTTAVWMHG